MSYNFKKHRILVTDCDTQAALACVRELGRSGYEVFGIGQASESATTASRYLSDYQKTSDVWETPLEAWFQTCSFAKRTQCAAILPVSEATIASSLRWGHLLSQEQTLLRANEAVLQFSLSKLHFFMRAQKLGLPVAAGRIVTPHCKQARLTDQDFPMIVRTDNSWGKNNRYFKGRSWIVHSWMEWQALRDELQQLDIDCLLQSYVTGHGCGAFLCMEAGHRVIWHTHQRLAEIPWNGGASARRQLNFDETLICLAEKFLSGLNLDGIAMVEFRKRHRDSIAAKKEGPLYLVEINARPWGSLALAGHARIPFITQWLQSRGHFPIHQRRNFSACVEIQPSRKDPFICTNIYPGEVQHLLSVAKSLKRSELSLPQAIPFFIASLGTLLNLRTRYDFFVWDDPTPCLAQWKKYISHVAARLMRFAGKTLVAAQFRVQELIHHSFHRKTSKTDLILANKILIICYGNRCRSAFVEAYLKKEINNFKTFYFSRGLCVEKKHIPSRFHKYFVNNGLNPGHHTARELGRDDLEYADLIVFMEKKHLQEVVRKFGFNSIKNFLLLDDPIFGGRGNDIQDPYVLNPLAARQVFEILDHRCRQWASLLG